MLSNSRSSHDVSQWAVVRTKRERKCPHYPHVRSRELTDQQPRAQSGMEHILYHSGMGSIGTPSITQTNESESPEPRPQPPTPPSEVVSSETLDRAAGATFTGPTAEVSNEPSRPSRPEHLPFSSQRVGWVGQNRSYPDLRGDRLDPRWRSDQTVSTSGFSKSSDDLFQVVQLDTRPWVTSEGSVMDRLHAFFVALEYLNICEFTMDASSTSRNLTKFLWSWLPTP